MNDATTTAKGIQYGESGIGPGNEQEPGTNPRARSRATITGFVLPGAMLKCEWKPIDRSITRDLPQRSSIQASECRPHMINVHSCAGTHHCFGSHGWTITFTPRKLLKKTPVKRPDLSD